jgi:hypothetical protein
MSPVKCVSSVASPLVVTSQYQSVQWFQGACVALWHANRAMQLHQACCLLGIFSLKFAVRHACVCFLEPGGAAGMQ